MRGLGCLGSNRLFVWFPASLTRWGRAFLAFMLLFGAGGEFLYVWAPCRNPRDHGVLAPRFGLLISGGALDALEGD